VVKSASRSIGLALLVSALVGLCAGCGVSAVTGDSSAKGSTTITDVLGRHVKLTTPAPRVLLGGSRLLYTTALLNKADPTANIVGWPDDLQQNDPDTYQRYAQKFPKVRSIPTTGELSDGSFSVEKAIELHPDVFVASASSFKAAQEAGTIDKLDRAGIPTVVVDYFVHPIHNTVPSIRIMGRLFGRQPEADKFITYYESAMRKVRSRLAAARQPATPAFLWRAPGYYDCCATFARSNLASLVTFAGGANLGDRLLSAKQGTLSPEIILKDNPPVVIATGADWAPGTPAVKGGFVSLGYKETPARAKGELNRIIAKQAGFNSLQAVRNHRFFVAWHHFYDSPYNFLGVEWFAKWLHPDLFRDVHPGASMRELHEEFLPVAPGGTFWTGLS
jgi:iron complex transport system substrate-binding protein